MMITVSDFLQVLKQKYPDIKFFNGCTNKEEKCVGVFARGNSAPPQAVGSPPSYRILPITILVHWDENALNCEQVANRLYQGLEDKSIGEISGHRVILIQLMESSPVNLGRDDNNKCEMTIRLNLFYDR